MSGSWEVFESGGELLSMNATTMVIGVSRTDINRCAGAIETHCLLGIDGFEYPALLKEIGHFIWWIHCIFSVLGNR